MDCRIKSAFLALNRKAPQNAAPVFFVDMASGGRAVIKADFVDQLAGGLAVLGNVGK